MDPSELNFIQTSIVGFAVAFTLVLNSDFAFRHTDEETRRELALNGVGSDIVVAFIWSLASLPLVFAMWLPFRTLGMEGWVIITYYAISAAAIILFYYYWDYFFFVAKRKTLGLVFAGIGLALNLAAMIVWIVGIVRVWNVEPFASNSRISGALAPTFGFIHLILFGIVFFIYLSQSNLLPESVNVPFRGFASGKNFKVQ